MIFYKIKNKSNGNIETVTKQAKELIERSDPDGKKYEVLNECDQHGREFDYNNFLNQANGKHTITIEIGHDAGSGKKEKKEKPIDNKSGTECEGSSGGLDVGNIKPIDITEITGNGNKTAGSGKSSAGSNGSENADPDAKSDKRKKNK